MSQQLSLERMIADWMADEASGAAPDALADQILATTSEMRPLPRWLAIVREPAMRSAARAVVGVPLRHLVLVATLALLGAALVGAAALFLLRSDPPLDGWPGSRGDASRAGLGVRGPIGNPTIEWQFHAAGAVSTDIAVDGDLVVVASDDGVLHGLAVVDGRDRWQVAFPGALRGPYVLDGRIYIGTGDGIVHALHLADGSRIWDAAVARSGSADLTAFDGRLYLGTDDGNLVALDLETGTESWRVQVSPDATPVHAPAAAAGLVVATSDDGYLAAIDGSTGAIRWRVQASQDPVGTPVISDGTVYLGAGPDTLTGRLAAFDVSTGTERWAIEQALFSPSVADGIGYSTSSNGRIAAIDLATGAVRWSATVDGMVRPAAVAGDVVYVSADAARYVAAFDRSTGGELWRLDVDGSNACCIAAARGLLFLGTSAGTVYAIGGDGTTLTGSPAPTTTSAASALHTATPPPIPATLAWAVDSGTAGFIPWGLARSPDGRYWAAEAIIDRFAIFEADGTFVERWGVSGHALGQFDFTRDNGDPYGAVAFAPDGSFFVLDVGNHRVQAFDAERTLIRAWGSFGNGVGQFIDPVGLAIDDTGNVSVLDDGRRVIETFDPSGTVLRTIKLFPAEVAASASAQLLAIGPNGDFFVSTYAPNVVIELDRTGALVRVYGGGATDPFVDQPNAMAFDADGRLYVTQGPLRGDRPGLVIFDPDGTYLGGFGPPGTGDADLGFAWGLVVDDDGIVIADAGGVPEFGLRSVLRKFEPIAFP
jgi:eukaryotic-like serine/threonine-protein kinase